EMTVVQRVLRNDRSSKKSAFLEWGEQFVVEAPALEPIGGEVLHGFELRPQERGVQLTESVRGAEVDPGVLVDLTAQETAPVGSFVANDLGALGELRLIDEKRSALTGRDVLRLVEAEGREVSQTSCGTQAVHRSERLRGVFDHEEAVASCDRADRVHLARD